MEQQNFKGFSPDTYQFLMELQFNNDRAFFDANRARCKREVTDPMRAIALDLLSTALEINPDFNPSLSRIVSRMNRDTRFSPNKQPYRDHSWLAFRPGEGRLSENLVLYFEIGIDAYGYGLGMYNSNPALMKPFRERAMADPERFLEIVQDEKLASFAAEGEFFSRDRFPNAPDSIKPYINRKGLSFSYSSSQLKKTMDAALFEEVREAFMTMKSLYRFMAGLEI